MKLKLLPLLCLLVITGYGHNIIPACPADNKTITPIDGIKQHCAFCVLACIAWWSHDAVGYHPAMFLMLENVSGHDLSGEEIPFQARFADLRDGFITVAREYKRTPVHKHERFAILLRAPKSFELPIDSSLWPTMECKAMCRFTDKNDSSPRVEDLFVTHLTRITLSDEDAHAQLIVQAERSPLLAQREKSPVQVTDEPAEDGDQVNTASNAKATSNPVSSHSPAKPPASSLKRNAALLKQRGASSQQKDAVLSAQTKTKVSNKLPKHLPKIGDDFYVFEQLYGNAHEFQPSSSNGTDDLTWAHYKASPPLFDIYAGSRTAGKADVLIITLSDACVPKEAGLLSLVKLLAGCKTSTPINPFIHSVRYLPEGRSEIITTGIRDRRIVSFKLQDNANSGTTSPAKIAIFVTRLPGDPEAALTNYIKRVNFLHLTN